jgi:hypothetical protein
MIFRKIFSVGTSEIWVGVIGDWRCMERREAILFEMVEYVSIYVVVLLILIF